MRYEGLVKTLSTSVVEPEPQEPQFFALGPECITDPDSVPEPDFDPNPT
jgi:hypothetical protein